MGHGQKGHQVPEGVQAEPCSGLDPMCWEDDRPEEDAVGSGELLEAKGKGGVLRQGGVADSRTYRNQQQMLSLEGQCPVGFRSEPRGRS